jgi:hypothetical protein
VRIPSGRRPGKLDPDHSSPTPRPSSGRTSTSSSTSPTSGRSRARARGALVTLALGGAAAVALAGCAVTPAPVGQPYKLDPTPSGSTLTSAKSVSPRQQAVAYADAMLASFVVPPGATKLSAAPAVDDGVLESSDQVPVSLDEVDKAEWWLVPGVPTQVLAWEAAHLPHRFSTYGLGESGATGRQPSWSQVWALPNTDGGLNTRDLAVETVADGQKDTAIRVEARATWQPTRPAGEEIPKAAKAVTISQDLGLNQGSTKPPKPVTITDPATVGKLIALINALPLTPPGIHSCPASFGGDLTLTFRAGKGTPALSVATDQLSGCAEMTLSIGGKPQPALEAASGEQILKIAGLPWKIPVP